MSFKPTLVVDQVSKRYHGRSGVQANDRVSLTVPPGQVVGLLGHNGAGKTTLVGQIVGLLRPDSGRISLAGHDAVAHPGLARQLTSVQVQTNCALEGITPRTAIRTIGRIRGGGRAEVRARTDQLIDALDLEPWADRPSEQVSGGVARLTAFGMAAVVPGVLTILDEPTNDVDPVRRRLLWGQIRGLAERGTAVLLITHNVREAEQVVDRLVVLERGQVVAAGDLAELTDQGRIPLEDAYIALCGRPHDQAPPPASDPDSTTDLDRTTDMDHTTDPDRSGADPYHSSAASEEVRS
ncbi:MAG: ABC transporter ATP-binding protein [Propionibacteriaceae bacterium]|jgi:ABC-2 type transport system ATP-binding protein|nr:ABC transporter ATP-binding protein [Propionibacteriaceae bacterium]